MQRALMALFAGMLVTSCATASYSALFPYDGPPADHAVLEQDVAAANTRIESFFGERFREPVHIMVAPTRAAFDTTIPSAWQITPSQCWMVGVGTADALRLLSPSAWRGDACEHDGDNAAEVQAIITHELTHAFHGQHNPTRDFTGMDDVGWFVEGLAVLVAGQMNDGHLASAADAIAANAAPAHLAEAWSGRYRYGVSGSMVAYIDATYGRPTLVSLLSATTNAQILDALHVSEAEFLERWRAWVVSQH